MRYVLTDYHARTDRPYRNMLHDPETDEKVQVYSAFNAAAEAAGLRDGDEFVLVAVPTGQRPFGDRRVVLVEPHTYRREPK